MNIDLLTSVQPVLTLVEDAAWAAQKLAYLGHPDPSLDNRGLLHQLFEASVQRDGNRVAVECQGRILRYRELEEKANQLAHFLANAGIQPGHRVCLLLPKSLELYIAMLGILKAGASYVPLDPSYPKDRVQFIAEDSGAKVLLTSLEFLDLEGHLKIPKLFYNEVRLDIERQSINPLSIDFSAENEAYVIYTSGTTGKPKGVSVTHGNAFHLINAEQQIYAVQSDDRVLQGFSVAFDASIEEIWIAFKAGATLVVGTPEIMHAGPDLGPRLAELNITVLSCVPTLLAMLPEPVASVRLLILGGESLAENLVQPWFSSQRRIYNTYGPTETTVVATLSLCQTGEPITIGRPLANYTAYIMDENGQILDKGQEGELVIGGYGVTKGYVNREELTQQRFIHNPYTALTGDTSSILYRTGDLARITLNNDIEYLGRIDTQVKIRGFRVELAEIETLLLGITGVRNAVALIQEREGNRFLAAFVMLAQGVPFDEQAAIAVLKQKLPPYMVPAYIEPLASFPTLASGKIDRQAFPQSSRKIVRWSTQAFDTPLKTLFYEKWSRLFDNEHIEEGDNFFTDLGGHSLSAAKFVSEMREDKRFADLSMSDIYAYPSIRELASFLEAKSGVSTSGTETVTKKIFHSIPAWQYRLSGVIQAVMIYAVTGVFALQWITPFMVYSFLKAYEYPIWESLSAAFVSLICVYPFMLLLGIISKWLILGRLKEGDYPIWGAYYLRWLLVQRLFYCVPLHYLAGTPLMPLYLRLLGADIGKEVHIDSHLVSGLDVLTMGNQCCINADANISCFSVEDGFLKIRKVTIGSKVCVGIRSVIGQDVIIGDNTVIDDLSCIRSGQRLGANEVWAGSPAVQMASPSKDQTAVVITTKKSWAWNIFAYTFYAVSFFILPVLALVPIFPGIVLMYHFDYASEDYLYLFLAPIVALLFVLLTALQIVVLKRLILGKLKAGVYPIHSVFYMRKWVIDKLMASSLDMLRTLYATLYVNPWYRALGVNVGKFAEISTASFILPDLLQIGEGSFIADGVGLGPAKISNGNICLENTVIGSNTFIGNSAYVPTGNQVGDNCLLGCQTVPPEKNTPDDTSWVGSPAVYLPQRQKSKQQFAEERTYHPSRKLYYQRLFIEFFRVILPATAFVVCTTLMLSFAVQMEDRHGPLLTLLTFPLIYIYFGVAAIVFTVFLKKLVIGRYTPDEQPLWSTFVWRTELITGFCENFTNEIFVNLLLGTVFMPTYLRLLGMRIGKRACILSTDFTEFDLVHLGDDVALNEDCTIQTHLFEDRIMKLSTINIGSRVSIGSYTLVLYDTVIEDDVKVGDLSLVMKGERLYQGTEWIGSPVKSIAMVVFG